MEKEIEKELTTLADNVKSFNEKAAKVEAVEISVGEVKETIESVKSELLSLKDASIKKDEADKKNQQWIDAQIARGQAHAINGNQSKDFNQVLAEKLEKFTDNIDAMSKGNQQGRKDFSIDLSGTDFQTKAVGDVSIANYTGGTRGLTQLRDGIIPGVSRKIHVRDILPMGTAGPGTEFVFMKENGAGEGAIAPVAEGATKPQIDMDLVEASVKFETIAGWLRVTRKAMNNIKGFTSWLQSRLPEKLLLIEDALLLNGDGVSPNIKGLQVAGNFTAATGAATINIEQIVQAMSQLEELERGEATGIVVRPSDYYNMLLLKDSQNAYTQPGIVTVTSDGVLRVLGTPVIKTTAQTVDKFLVGDFRMGAQLLVQEGIRVDFFEQDGDNVRTNKVTVRIEETIAFPVYGADYFVFGDFGDVV